jgi:hypothetical protein
MHYVCNTTMDYCDIKFKTSFIYKSLQSHTILHVTELIWSTVMVLKENTDNWGKKKKKKRMVKIIVTERNTPTQI